MWELPTKKGGKIVLHRKKLVGIAHIKKRDYIEDELMVSSPKRRGVLKDCDLSENSEGMRFSRGGEPFLLYLCLHLDWC